MLYNLVPWPVISACAKALSRRADGLGAPMRTLRRWWPVGAGLSMHDPKVEHAIGVFLSYMRIERAMTALTRGKVTFLPPA